MTEREVDEGKRATLKRFAALGATTPLVRLSANENSEVRGAIVGYLAATPGAHFSKLRDDLRLGTGEAQHHLRKLEASGEIESWKDADYRRYVPAGRFDDLDKRALGYLRRDTPRGMILTLLRNPNATGVALAESLGVSRPTVSAAAADLDDAGLLDRSDGYTLTEPERLVTLVVRYADSFDAEAVAFADDAASLVRYDP